MNVLKPPPASPPALPPDLVARFAGIVGDKYAVTDPQEAAPYLTEERGLFSGHSPLILRPGSAAEVAAICKLATETRTALVPQGGNTGLVGGQMPHGEVVVSTRRLDKIRAVDTRSNTMTVEAGVILLNAQQRAAEAERLFPLSLGAEGSCTIGGNLSTNAGGIAALAYGVARDLVLGLEVVLADGTVLSMLNQMVKNNAGMDLKHLFIGSEGVLGIVTRVVFKLQPLPKGVSTAVVALHDYPAALRFLRHAQQSLSGQVSAFEIMWNDYLVTAVAAGKLRAPLDTRYPVYVLIDMHCGQPETDAGRFEAMLEQAIEAGWILDGAVAQSVAEAEAFWAIRDGVAEVLRDYAPTLNFDVSVPIAQIGECAARIRAELDRDWPALKALFFGHVGDGNLHVVVCKVPSDHDSQMRIEDAVYSVVRSYGGSISAEHGIGTLKRDWLHYSRSEAELALMRTLKHTLDPKNILNPGKLI